MWEALAAIVIVLVIAMCIVDSRNLYNQPDTSHDAAKRAETCYRIDFDHSDYFWLTNTMAFYGNAINTYSAMGDRIYRMTITLDHRETSLVWSNNTYTFGTIPEGEEDKMVRRYLGLPPKP